ncbi:hypothetical protein DFP73DRAFT_556623 [Morchella snyderi]|nr:hypothetical protein DFP73DRAFT_556623 [Morchella snyderi]
MATDCGGIFTNASSYQRHFQTSMVKVTVGGTQTFYAHEGILSKSDFFQKALNGGFKEASTREVLLPEDDPEIFSSVLEYLYSEEYAPRLKLTKVVKNSYDYNHSLHDSSFQALPCIYGSKPKNEDIALAALRHAKIYCLADKLGLKHLQTLVITKLKLSGPLLGVDFLKVASYLMQNSYDSDGSLGAFLSSYVSGVPKQV